jgi:hypothetical protein
VSAVSTKNFIADAIPFHAAKAALVRCKARISQQTENIMRKIIIALALGTVMVPATAFADVGIDARQANQQRQIDAGKRSGKLTRNERDVLTVEQRSIKREEGRLRMRGGFSNRDQAYIGGLLDRAQRHIDRLKNNRVRTRGTLDI